MLQQAQVVKFRKAIESLYDGVCNITQYKKVMKENKSTEFKEEIVLKAQPCRLSYKTIVAAEKDENMASNLKQVAVLFIAPEVILNPGSKITITQNGITSDYKASGKPAMYSTHQEVVLELFERWA